MSNLLIDTRQFGALIPFTLSSTCPSHSSVMEQPYDDGRTHGNSSVHNQKSHIRSESPEPSSMFQAVSNVVYPTPPCFSVNGPPSIEYPPPSSLDPAPSNYHGGVYGGSTSTSSSIAQSGGGGGGASSSAWVFLEQIHAWVNAGGAYGLQGNREQRSAFILCIIERILFCL